MITKVVDERGQVVHDCNELGCVVSWDGFVIDAKRYQEQLQEAGHPWGKTETFERGDAAVDRQEIDTEAWEVTGHRAKLRGMSG